MFTDQNPDSSLADVIAFSSMDDLCDSDACSGVVCPPGLICRDIWRENICICPEGEMFDENGVCVPISDCSIPRCVWGDCVMVSDPNNPGELIWSCNCYPGWTGVHCNETDPLYLSATATVSTGWMSSVSAALLLLLILLLIVICCTKTRKAGLLDEPDFAKDFVMEYNEDGGGEEDMQGYELGPLKKPVEVIRSPDTDKVPFVEELPRTAPEPLHAERPPIILPYQNGKELPNVGQFIEGRLVDADNDRSVPPHDSVREYEYEGEGSLAETLSSIETTSSGGDQDMNYLLSFGAPFAKLADLYLGGSDDDEDGYKDDRADDRAAISPRVVELSDTARDRAQELAYKQALATEQLRLAESNARQRQEAVGMREQRSPHGVADPKLADGWQQQQTLSRDETRASIRDAHRRESSGETVIVEQPTRRQQAADRYHPDLRLDDQDNMTLRQELVASRQNVGVDYPDVRSDYSSTRMDLQETDRMAHQDIGIPYQDTALQYHDVRQEVRTSRSVQRSVKTTHVVQATSKQEVITGQSVVTGFPEQNEDIPMISLQREGRRIQSFDQVFDGSADSGDHHSTPSSLAFTTDNVTGASARMVKTEHISWTQNKQIRQFEDSSEV